MKYTSIFLFLLMFISVLSLEKSDKNVEYIEREDVEAYVTNHPLVLVHWYNSWCTFCKEFAPKWNALSDLAVNAENEFKLIKVEIGDDNDFKKLYEITQVPDFGVFVDGEYSHFYGNKEAGDILHFVSNHTSDGTIKINHYDQIHFLKDKSNAIIIGLVEEGSEEEKVFKNNVLRDDNSLYSIPSAPVREQLMKKFELSIPSLLIFKSFDEMVVTFTEEFTDEKVSLFIHQNNRPVIYPTKNPRYKNHIFQHGREWMTLLIDKENAKYPSALSNRYLEICKNNRETVCFYISKSEKTYYDFYTEGKSLQFPAMITVRRTRGFYFKHYFPPIQKMSTEEISLYLHNIISGVIKPELQSDKLPTNDLPYLQTVVGTNFEEEVMKSKEDVVVQFYSDACDHCSKMMKRFEKVASMFAEDDSIRFMKFSTNTNDIDVEGIHAYHYHSVLYIHKGEKIDIVEYPRSRKVWRTKALTKWILNQKESFSMEKEEEEL